jgi:hypothetical protein
MVKLFVHYYMWADAMGASFTKDVTVDGRKKKLAIDDFGGPVLGPRWCVLDHF